MKFFILVIILFLSPQITMAKDYSQYIFEELYKDAQDIVNEDQVNFHWGTKLDLICVAMPVRDETFLAFLTRFLDATRKHFFHQLGQISVSSDVATCPVSAAMIIVYAPMHLVDRKTFKNLSESFDLYFSGTTEIARKEEKSIIGSGYARLRYYHDSDRYKAFIIIRAEYDPGSELERQYEYDVLIQELFQSFVFGGDISNNYYDSILYEDSRFYSYLVRKYLNTEKPDIKIFQELFRQQFGQKLCKLDIMLMELILHRVGEQAPFTHYQQVIEEQFDSIQAQADEILAHPDWADFVDPECRHTK